jgi:hypothetical protein
MHYGCQFAIHRAMRKYIPIFGDDAFSLELLDDQAQTDEQLNILENYWIIKLGTLSPGGYNLTDGGQGGVFCEETRRKLSEINMGHPVSASTRKLIGEAQTLHFKNHPEAREQRSQLAKEGNYAARLSTPETNAKKGKHMLGKHLSDKQRAILSASAKTRVGALNPFFGKQHTIDTRKHLSEQKQGDKNHFFGKKRPEHAAKMSLKMKKIWQQRKAEKVA